MAERPSVVDRGWRVVYRLGFPVRSWLRYRLSLGRGGAFVAIRCDHELLLVRHSYRPRLDLVGGGIDAGETAEACARREVHEEVGLTVPPAALRPLGVVRRGFRGRDARDHVFEWRVAALPSVRIDHREIVWAGLVRPSDVPRRELDVTVRWYLRRFAPDLRQPRA